jgi:hypothetical protein
MTDRPPQDSHTPAHPDTPRSRKIFWIKFLSLMALTLLAVFILFRITAHRALNQRIQAVRDAGYPISPDEFNDWYKTPEGKNAADIYLRAFAAFPIDTDTKGVPIVSTLRKKYTLGQPLDPDMKKRIEDYLALHTKTIALIEQAAQIKETRFPLDMSEGYMLLLPHLGQLRRSARILQLQSILDADRGDYDLAAQRCITILAIAHSMENEPIHISSLVSNAILALAYNQIEMLVNTGQLSDDTLQQLAHAIEPIDYDAMFLRAMVGERCFNHLAFNDSKTLASVFPFGGTANRLSLAVWRTAGLLDIDHSTSLDIMTSYVDFAENPSWPIPPSLTDIDDRVPQICFVTRYMIPAISSAYQAFIRGEARRQTVLVGIAAERYRQQHNQFPTQLTDLVPDFLNTVPLDPFDNQPLRYRTEPTGAIIYSIGVDGNDDDGRALDDEGILYQVGTDIPFTFGGLQERLWPQPEIQEDDGDDPYNMGGYGGYDDPDDFDDDEEPLKDETETTTAPQESVTTEEDMPQ